MDCNPPGSSVHGILQYSLAWRILWTEEPDGLQSMRSQRTGPEWSHLALTYAHMTRGIFSSPTRDWTCAPQKWKLKVPWTTRPPGKSPDTFLTKWLGQKGWTSLLRLGYKNTLASVLLAFSQSLTCSEGSQPPCCEMPCGGEGADCGREHVAVNELPSPLHSQGWLSPANSHPSELRNGYFPSQALRLLLQWKTWPLPHEQSWVRVAQLTCSQVLAPQQLWDHKCLLF